MYSTHIVCVISLAESELSSSSPLYALILTPTRELALQIRDHIRAVTKYTAITVWLYLSFMIQ